MVAGCLCAGKITQKLNQNIFIGASLLVMGVCLLVVPSCGNLATLSVTMVLHGFFSGSFSVGGTLWCFLSVLSCSDCFFFSFL